MPPGENKDTQASIDISKVDVLVMPIAEPKNCQPQPSDPDSKMKPNDLKGLDQEIQDIQAKKDPASSDSQSKKPKGLKNLVLGKLAKKVHLLLKEITLSIDIACIRVLTKEALPNLLGPIPTFLLRTSDIKLAIDAGSSNHETPESLEAESLLSSLLGGKTASFGTMSLHFMGDTSASKALDYPQSVPEGGAFEFEDECPWTYPSSNHPGTLALWKGSAGEPHALSVSFECGLSSTSESLHPRILHAEIRSQSIEFISCITQLQQILLFFDHIQNDHLINQNQMQQLQEQSEKYQIYMSDLTDKQSLNLQDYFEDAVQQLEPTLKTELENEQIKTQHLSEFQKSIDQKNQSKELEASQYIEAKKTFVSLNAHFKRVSFVLIAEVEVSKDQDPFKVSHRLDRVFQSMLQNKLQEIND